VASSASGSPDAIGRSVPSLVGSGVEESCPREDEVVDVARVVEVKSGYHAY
jgi:hypothetical protein